MVTTDLDNRHARPISQCTIEASFRVPIMVAPSHSHIIVSLLLNTIQVPNGKFKQIPTRFIKIIAAYGRSPKVHPSKQWETKMADTGVG